MSDLRPRPFPFSGRRENFLLLALGLAMLVPYLYALQLRDLRQHTVEFEFAFFAAFALYTLAVILALRMHDDGPASTRQLALIFALGIVFRIVLICSQPRLSDDMYRYVWEGRTQSEASGFSPYLVPPDAPELSHLRDEVVWPLINRKSSVTVYPPGAEMVFAALWRIWPDNVHWFQIAMTAGDLLAGALLVLLLRALGQPPQRVLIYLWSPLVIFEIAHSAHVDGLILPFLVGAWLMRVRGRDGWTGALLGAATALKLYPIVLLPALWRPRNEAGRRRPTWLMLLTCAAVIALAYAPYLLQGALSAGYLPAYFDETGNMSLAFPIIEITRWLGGQPERVANGVLAAVMLVISLILMIRPAVNAKQALQRCLWPIGAFLVLTQLLHPWYVLWLVPLVALFLQPGRRALVFDAWTGWFLFAGAVVISYTFYIAMKAVIWTFLVEFVPLYVPLIVPPLLRRKPI
jgi:alpha-1,6-mannosyltransferase